MPDKDAPTAAKPKDDELPKDTVSAKDAAPKKDDATPAKEAPAEKPDASAKDATPTKEASVDKTASAAKDAAPSGDDACPKAALESEVRAKIDKEIAERKSDASDKVQVDSDKAATIEAEVRKKLDAEISERKVDPKKAGAAAKKPRAGKRKRPRKKGMPARPQRSEREQKILEEKANIDAKLKKRNKILYPAISGGFLVALVILFLVNKDKNQPATQGSSGTTIRTIEGAPTGGNGGKVFKASATFKAATEAANALVRQRDYQGAVDHYRAHMVEFPGDAEACDKAIAQIDANYLNPTALPPADPKAQGTREDRQRMRDERRRQRLGGEEPGADAKLGALDDIDSTLQGLNLPITKDEPGGEADPFADDLLLDDSSLLEKPDEEKKKADDPFGDIDNLLE